jgi:DNA-binding transcriptional regulator YhcF (GntR family)
MTRRTKSPAVPSPRDNAPAASVPAAEALSFLRDTRGLSTWAIRDAAKTLNVSFAEAKRVIAILELQGYVKASSHNEWMTTIAGEEVSDSKPPRFTRERIEQALSNFRNRIAQVNADKKALYRITRAVAFGDFLSDRVRFQSAEVGIELKLSARSTVDAGSPEDERGRQKFLKQLHGRGTVVRVRAFEEWMSDRTHTEL